MGLLGGPELCARACAGMWISACSGGGGWDCSLGALSTPVTPSETVRPTGGASCPGGGQVVGGELRAQG